MEIRLVDALDPAMNAIERILLERHKEKLPSYGCLSDGSTLIMASFEGESPDAFGIFRSYRDPGLHVGSHLQLDEIRDIIEMETVLRHEDFQIGQIMIACPPSKPS